MTLRERLTYERMLADRARTHTIPGRLLALDPGHESGIALFINGTLVHRRQMQITPDIGHKLEELFNEVYPDIVVCEAYRIYATHAKQHINSDVPTLRLIGRIEHVCEMRGIPIEFQSASQGKGFMTDDTLRLWKMIKENEPDSIRHSRDAVRHGAHFLLFG